jgi:hypothetical protein
MKQNSLPYGKLTVLARLALALGLSLLVGCASTPTETATSKVQPLSAGVKLHQDKDIQGVWLAEGFDFKGYDTLYIAAPVFAATERPNETQMRAMAMRVLPEQLVEHLRDTKLFATVTTRAEEVKPEAKKLNMQDTIIEYEKGGGGARYFAGIFGGGQPVIKVRGQVLEGDKVMCIYELKRSGESAGSRLGGVWMSDEEIQRNDIRDLASDLSDFFRRTAKVQ